MSLRKDAVLLVKNLTDAADALLNKAGNWGGKDRLRAVLKKIKKDVSKCLDWGSVNLNVTYHTPLHSIFSLATFAGQTACASSVSQSLQYNFVRLNYALQKLNYLQRFFSYM